MTVKLIKSPCVTVSPWPMGLFEKWVPPNPIVMMAIWGQAPLKDTAAVEELMKSLSFSLLCLKPDYASCINMPTYNNQASIKDINIYTIYRSSVNNPL